MGDVPDGRKESWCGWELRSLVDRNPLVWMAEVDGRLVNLREMPRAVQVIAYEKGMIPYIPADQR